MVWAACRTLNVGWLKYELGVRSVHYGLRALEATKSVSNAQRQALGTGESRTWRVPDLASFTTPRADRTGDVPQFATGLEVRPTLFPVLWSLRRERSE